MTYFESILKVLLVGLVLGAGLPAIFATGMVAYSFGAGGEEADHRDPQAQPGAEVSRASCCSCSSAFVIVTAVAWITRATIIHHFGIDLFPMFPKK